METIIEMSSVPEESAIAQAETVPLPEQVELVAESDVLMVEDHTDGDVVAEEEQPVTEHNVRVRISKIILKTKRVVKCVVLAVMAFTLACSVVMMILRTPEKSDGSSQSRTARLETLFQNLYKLATLMQGGANIARICESPSPLPSSFVCGGVEVEAENVDTINITTTASA